MLAVLLSWQTVYGQSGAPVPGAAGAPGLAAAFASSRAVLSPAEGGPHLVCLQPQICTSPVATCHAGGLARFSLSLSVLGREIPGHGKARAAPTVSAEGRVVPGDAAATSLVPCHRECHPRLSPGLDQGTVGLHGLRYGLGYVPLKLMLKP